MSDKKGLLPKVSENVLEEIVAKIDKAEGNSFASEILGRLAENNPIISGFISNYTSTMAEETRGIYLGVVLYALLEAQAERDYLDQFDLGIKDIN
ncbi:MAG: hypothetical protein V1914_04545 [archaeon]